MRLIDDYRNFPQNINIDGVFQILKSKVFFWEGSAIRMNEE